jgi:4-hydroxyphenylpyruvate dioxygenase
VARQTDNPLGMRGIAFVEFASAEPERLRRTFRALGLARTHGHRRAAVDAYRQAAVLFLVNREPGSFAARFCEEHGPCVSAVGFAFDDPRAAHAEALRRGARAFEEPGATLDAPAVHGIGGSLVYFVDGRAGIDGEMLPLDRPDEAHGAGLVAIDHLTNNVEAGTLSTWSDYYRTVFGFTEVRSFDIEGRTTGLYSHALRSPCGTFCIPINEDKGDTGQIAEYLREYRGPGVQHIAFLTRDLLASLDAIGGAVPTLDVDPDYYAHAFERVPRVRESPGRIRAHGVLVDGDEQGYLLQIFTKNLVGPIFFELIQRENYASFGEGNFSALFRSIERQEEKRRTGEGARGGPELQLAWEAW